MTDGHVQGYLHEPDVPSRLRQQIPTLQGGQQTCGQGVGVSIRAEDPLDAHLFQATAQESLPGSEIALDIPSRLLVRVGQFGSQRTEGTPVRTLA